MNFHGISMLGPLVLQKVATLPVWSSADEGRLVYNLFDKKTYYANDSAWAEVSISTHTHAGVYLPVAGTAADSTLFASFPTSAYARTNAANSFSSTNNMQDNLLIRPEIKDYSETFVDCGTGGDYTFNLENGNNFERIVNNNAIFTFNNPPATGRVGSFTLMLINGASYSITWPTSVKWPNDVVPVLGANTTSLVDVLTFFTVNGGTRWYGNLSMKKLPI